MITMKKALKFAGAACAATGVVALSGLVASGAAVGAVVEGFRSAAGTMKKMLADNPNSENDTAKTEKFDMEMVAVSSDTENQEVSAN